MSIKAISILRSTALLGVAAGAFAVFAPAASVAQLVPRADFPGAKQQEDLAGAPPRADFPGAKQGEIHHHYHHHHHYRSSIPQRPKLHHAG